MFLNDCKEFLYDVLVATNAVRVNIHKAGADDIDGHHPRAAVCKEVFLQMVFW